LRAVVVARSSAREEMDVILATQQNALTGSPSVDWTRKKANARESNNHKFVVSRYQNSVDEVKQAIRTKYDRAGPIDRGPAFRRMRASCGGQLDLPGFRHFLDLSGIYVTNPPGRDIVRELWESKRSAATNVIEFPEFAEMCFGNQPIVSDFGAPSENELAQLQRSRNRTKFQDAQADAMFRAAKSDHFAILREKLSDRGKQSFSEKFTLLQLLASCVAVVSPSSSSCAPTAKCWARLLPTSPFPSYLLFASMCLPLSSSLSPRNNADDDDRDLRCD
jgi:hypothetical protein